MRVAFVTGAGSGIGKALATALAGRGDTVVCADVDGEAAGRVADSLGPRASAVALDVTDAVAVEESVRKAHAQHGRLDLVVNNAGIGFGGEVRELTLDHWYRILDVNLRGVIHGVHSAYPLMIDQGHGHILNTASLAGLVPTPFLTPYVASKHAVVGLSLALRAEAAAHGIGVTVLCPSFVDTPMLDSRAPDGLPPTSLAGRGREFVSSLARPCTPEGVAAEALKAVDRNAALAVVPRQARVAWLAHRASPRLTAAIARWGGARARRVATGGPPAT